MAGSSFSFSLSSSPAGAPSSLFGTASSSASAHYSLFGPTSSAGAHSSLFGAASSAGTLSSLFGATSSAGAPSSPFGAPSSASTPSFGFGAAASSASTPSFGFGSSASTPSFGFGSSASTRSLGFGTAAPTRSFGSAAAASSTPSFGFGSSAPTSSSSVAPSSYFSFTPSFASSPAATVSQASVFGTPSSTPATSSPLGGSGLNLFASTTTVTSNGTTNLFGTPSSQAPTTATTTTVTSTSSPFGSPLTPPSSPFGASSTAPTTTSASSVADDQGKNSKIKPEENWIHDKVKNRCGSSAIKGIIPCLDKSRRSSNPTPSTSEIILVTRILKGIPQSPHFLPLKGYSEVAKNNLINAWDRIFEDVVDQIHSMQTFNFDIKAKKLWETMEELQNMGYNVIPARRRLVELRDVMVSLMKHKREIRGLKCRAEEQRMEKSRLEFEIVKIRAKVEALKVGYEEVMGNVDNMEKEMPKFDQVFSKIATMNIQIMH